MKGGGLIKGSLRVYKIQTQPQIFFFKPTIVNVFYVI